MVKKFKVGEVYLTFGYNQYPYLCIRRTDKTVWFWDMINVDSVFRRTIKIYNGCEHSNSNIPDDYFEISAEYIGDVKKYTSYFTELNASKRKMIIDRVNKICGNKVQFDK